MSKSWRTERRAGRSFSNTSCPRPSWPQSPDPTTKTSPEGSRVSSLVSSGNDVGSASEASGRRWPPEERVFFEGLEADGEGARDEGRDDDDVCWPLCVSSSVRRFLAVISFQFTSCVCRWRWTSLSKSRRGCCRIACLRLLRRRLLSRRLLSPRR